MSNKSNKILRLENIDKVILFGGSRLLVAASDKIREIGLEILVYTSPRHAEEGIERNGKKFIDILNEKNIKCIITQDINSESSLINEISNNTIGLGFGEAWSFSKTIIDAFDGKLLDFMCIPLPRYRGGAHYSWLILSGQREWGCCIQVINEDMIQGEFDSGEIIKRRYYSFPDECRLPEDFFDYAEKENIRLIENFICEIKGNVQYQLEEINEEQSLFFSRLNTVQNGWIDWSWSGKEIERFICAFDEPYVGAGTMIEGNVVRLKSAKLIEGEKDFHPFQSGLIARIEEDKSIVVITTDGLLKIMTLNNSEGVNINKSVRLGARFFTPKEKLEEAMSFRASYGAWGLTNG